MRTTFEGLFGLVHDRLSCDPLRGHVFVFSNARRNRLKLLFRDGSGLRVCAKRLETGRFRWPEAAGEEAKIILRREELTLLPGGIDLAQTRRRSQPKKTSAVVYTCLRSNGEHVHEDLHPDQRRVRRHGIRICRIQPFRPG